MADTFTCARCGGTFSRGWSDDEAAAEAQGMWSAVELEDTAVICDDCFREFAPHIPRLRAELDQAAAAAGLTYEGFIRREVSRG